MNSYYTVTCHNFINPGMTVKLVREPDNQCAKEANCHAIKNGLRLIGYVANSIYMVKGESCSAGRIYDRIWENQQ